jgi:hypothetical protein
MIPAKEDTMKWTTKKSTKTETDRAAFDKLASKTVLDDLLGQINGGAAALDNCHPRVA